MKSANLPVKHTEKQINPTEHQNFFVKQPVDASLPPKQQLGEATKSCIGHFKGVRNCHVWVYCVVTAENSCKI